VFAYRDTREGGVVVDVAAEPAQELGHDPDVHDVGDVDERRPPDREQSGGHQLEGAVLGSRYPDVTDEPGAPDDPERFHPRIVGPGVRTLPDRP